MVKPHDYVVWLSEVDKDDTIYVGGKSANLGEMIKAKFPVPGGFALTAYSYFYFLKYNKLDIKIKHLLGTVDFKNNDSIGQVSKSIKKIIICSEIPDEIIRPSFKYYKAMGGVFKQALVAIRSSATSEDSKTASFAGQQETFLNVRGEAELLQKIKEGWASLFETRALFYRHENKLNHLTAGISLVVQKMVESESSGVMFTIDPITNDKSKVVIEAIYGLGEYIVQGRVTPDHFEVSKDKPEIINKTVADQTVMLKKVGTQNKEVKVSRFFRKRQKITNKDIIALSKLAKDIEKHYYFPQDIEWAKEKGKLYIVQTRPITTMGKEGENEEKKEYIITGKGEMVLRGDPASPGIGIGIVKILKSPKEIGKIQTGDVLVAAYTNPDYVPAMKKASAIVTEKGGRTSHAAIVSREFGIPAVVGADRAMSILKEGSIITVDGKSGEIYKGKIETKEVKTDSVSAHLKTATRIYVNLAEPELAERVSKMNVDGVGLLRAEFMIAEIGIHPKKLIKEKKQNVFIDKLSQDIETICRAFYPRPVIYRATDFKTNEYRNLKGGQEFEPFEPNPMLGYRGAFRYINDPEVFLLELKAIKRVRNEKGLNNLSMMIPFVRTVRDLEEVKRLINEHGLRRGTSFQLYMMVEIPSNVILLEDFINAGIDGVSIGSNDLTMLILGLDRDNSEVAVEFDERNKAVLWALEKIIKTCNKHGIKSSICGQAPSTYPDLAQKLVEWGITSVSVSQDAIATTRNVVYKAEQEIIKKR